MNETQALIIYVISDSLGEPAEMLAKAGRNYFGEDIEDIRCFPFITEEETICKIVAEASLCHALIMSMTSKPELTVRLRIECQRYGIPLYNVLDPFLAELRIMTGKKPELDPGKRNQLDEEYFRRMDAIEFTVKYDDGKRTDHLDQADIILLGVSRTSKTPISIYLANLNYKVANIPLMPEVEPARELFTLSSNKIFGLLLDPSELVSIREERLKSMRLTGKNSNYASLQRVEYELNNAQKLFDKLGCSVIDVTSKAIEEIANFILATIMRR